MIKMKSDLWKVCTYVNVGTLLIPPVPGHGHPVLSSSCPWDAQSPQLLISGCMSLWALELHSSCWCSCPQARTVDLCQGMAPGSQVYPAASCADRHIQQGSSLAGPDLHDFTSVASPQTNGQSADLVSSPDLWPQHIAPEVFILLTVLSGLMLTQALCKHSSDSSCWHCTMGTWTMWPMV